MKKEIFALTLSAVMAAGTCSIPVMAADDTYNVGICQLVQHEALDAATQGSVSYTHLDVYKRQVPESSPARSPHLPEVPWQSFLSVPESPKNQAGKKTAPETESETQSSSVLLPQLPA